MRIWITAVVLAALVVGCVAPHTDNSAMQPAPVPPMPGTTQKPQPVLLATASSAKIKSLQPLQMKSRVVAFKVMQSIAYTPIMTNVLTIRLIYTNGVVFGRLNRTNSAMGWKTNLVQTGDYVLSYPTNAWDYALIWSTNAPAYWQPVALTPGLPPRTTNGQWFEHRLRLRTGEQRFFQLAKVYSVNVVWNYEYGRNVNFRAYTGQSTHAYGAATNLTWVDTYVGTETNAQYSGYAQFTARITGFQVGTSVYLAMTAVDDQGTEGDFSEELVIPAQNR